LPATDRTRPQRQPHGVTVRRLLLAGAIGAAAAIVGWAQLGSGRSVEAWRAEAVAAYPHDPAAFTQGLVVDGGRLYESTGQYGASSLRRVDLASGRVEKLARLNPRLFGEGLTALGGRLYQLTWRSEVALVYDIETFELLETHTYPGEGWGLTDDGEHLILSDGTPELRFIDPESFAEIRRVEVRDGDVPVDDLNELEFIDGEVWANVWYDDRIVRIAPDDGRVVGWIDAGHLYPRSQRSSEDVLNGIAVDDQSGRIFVTGKNWPQVFEIEVVPARR
jgi:glutaminyl-peptide cyclotransferase